MEQSNRQEIAKIVSAGVTGTTAMTAFSYLVSEIKDEQFKEPQLLAELLQRIATLNKGESRVAGWNIHYAVGIMFAILYAKKWKAENKKPTITSGAVLGGLSGILAVLVWHTVFRLHPSPPKIKFKRYFGHLFVAHVIFGALASVGYNLISPRKRQ